MAEAQSVGEYLHYLEEELNKVNLSGEVKHVIMARIAEDTLRLVAMQHYDVQPVFSHQPVSH